MVIVTTMEEVHGTQCFSFCPYETTVRWDSGGLHRLFTYFMPHTESESVDGETSNLKTIHPYCVHACIRRKKTDLVGEG